MLTKEEIKKIKIERVLVDSVYVEEPKQVNKKDGTKTNVCKVSIKTSDSDKVYPRQYIKVSFWDFTKDGKTTTAKYKADKFKEEILKDMELYCRIHKESWEKDGKSGINNIGFAVTKTEKELAEQFLK